MSKHTPGNWQISQKTRYTVISDQPIESDYIAGSNDIAAYGGYLIAESVAPENLHLIAAAPSLLQAAEAAHEALANVHTCSTDGRYTDTCITCRLDAAIRRAKGEA